MTIQPDDKRKRAAYHQAGHALILICKGIYIDTICIPEDLPPETTSLDLKLSQATLERTDLNDQFTFTMAGIEAEKKLDNPPKAHDLRIANEFKNHNLEGLDTKWPINVAGARDTARRLIDTNRQLFDVIVERILESGIIRWTDLMQMKFDHDKADATKE